MTNSWRPCALDLQPVARPPAREVPRAEALRHDPFEPLLVRGREQRLPVVEALREAHGLVPLVEQLLEPLAPLLDRELDDRLALDFEQVEEVVDDRRAALALLHGGEARPPLLVERADLAVDHAVGRLQRLDELFRDVLEALGVVLVLPGSELGLSARDRRDDPVAVPLDLEEPVVALRHRVGQRGEHGLISARRTCGGRGVVLLADDQPVALVTRQMGRDERIGAFEALPVQPDREAAVGLVLDELVGAGVPDLDRAGAVLALRDLAVERRVLERMILDVNGEMLLAGLERDALGHRPARQRAVPLEAEVVVQPAGIVALDDEDRLLAALAAAEGLRRLLRVALASCIRPAWPCKA